jgi:predicted ATPase
LGGPLMAAKGYAAPEVEQAYARARELCRHVGETPRLLQVLLGLENYYFARGELQTARELAEQCLSLAQRMQEPARLLPTYVALGMALFHLGELTSARECLEQGIALYDPQLPHARPTSAVADPRVVCTSYTAWVLWFLGYPEQALQRSHEALSLAQELVHPFSQAFALAYAPMIHLSRREAQAARERAEATITLSNDQGFPVWVAFGTFYRGWALATQGQLEAGIAQLRQGLDAWLDTGSEVGRSTILVMLAEVYGARGQTEEGLTMLA